MSVSRVVNYQSDNQINLPVSGNGTNLVLGAILAKGASATGVMTTPGTDNGHLRLFSASTQKPVGILQQAHTASGGDTDVPGTTYTTRPIDLLLPIRAVRMEIPLTTADSFLVTNSSGTTVNTAGFDAGFAAGYIYVFSGTGIGQLLYVTASTATTLTLKSAPTVALDGSSRIIKILPKFSELLTLNAAGTKLSSVAAAGTIRGLVLDTFFVTTGYEKSLNPTQDDARTKLQSNSGLRFEADICFDNSIIYSSI